MRQDQSASSILRIVFYEMLEGWLWTEEGHFRQTGRDQVVNPHLTQCSYCKDDDSSSQGSRQRGGVRGSKAQGEESRQDGASQECMEQEG